MGDNTKGLIRAAKKLTVIGLGTAAVATAFMTLGTGSASAEVTEVAPRPNVTSRQAVIIDRNALRRTAQGTARGQLGENRSAGNGGISAQGEVRDSVMAVPGTTSSPFNLPRNGQFRTGAPIGSW